MRGPGTLEAYMKARLAAVLAGSALLSLGGVSMAASSAGRLSAGAGRAEAAGLEPAGLYSGSESQNGNGMHFYVSGSGTKVQDLVMNVVELGCPRGRGSLGPSIILDSISIGSTGSFSIKATQPGVVGTDSTPTTFTIKLHGAFGVSSSGRPDASGTYLETATYHDNGTTITCSSNAQTWSATRATQPTQPRGVGAAGTYRLAESQNGNPGSFTVSASRTEMQNLLISLVFLGCNPGGGTSTSIKISSLNLASDGSFSTEYQQTSGSATFTIRFQGHFHGVNSTGASRAAGSYRVTGTFTHNGRVYNCSSNKQSWDAVRNGP
jgi:hypothetical protein